MPESMKSVFYLTQSIFLIVNIILTYIFLEPKRSRIIQILTFSATWATLTIFRILLKSINLDPVLMTYILGSFYLIPIILIFEETLQAKIFVFYLIYSMTQLVSLIFDHMSYFLYPSMPEAFVMVGLILELAALPFINRYIKTPIKEIIRILDQHNKGFTFFPILSFLLLVCFAFQEEYILSDFMILLLSTVLIFFSYYMIATSIAGARRQQELVRISMTDALTELHNRRFMEQQIQQEYIRYQKTGSEFALVSADIDFFKKINDSFGHDCGDLLLKSVAGDMKSSIRTYDTAARWGGEEFLILLPSTNSEQAMILAERIRQRVENRRYHFDGSETTATVTLTLGVSVISSGETIIQMIRKADKALYYGKRKSRNCVVSFDEIAKVHV